MENNSLNHPIDKTLPSGQAPRLLSNIEVGAVPLVLFIGIAAIVAISATAGLLPKNMIGGLAVIMTLGFALAKIGRMVPILKEVGGPAILCLMTPSVLVYFGMFEAHTLDTVHLLMKEANLLYFVIACLVVGSILGMNRTILIQGMVRMFVPLVVGTGAAILTGLLVGSLFGYSFYHTFFFIIVPIIGGGIGVPPLFGAARQCGKNATVAVGFRNKDFVILEDDFRAAGCDLRIATDDGSYGHHGLVIDLIQDVHPDKIFACGPKVMLRAVTEFAKAHNIPCEISLEERMACGIGACLGCAVELYDENGETYMGHVCKDGPVFPAERVVF